MGNFHVVERFVSINGEGRRAGQLAMFIRFAGCNLSCEYCDTKWANDPRVAFEEYSAQALYWQIQESGVKNVTLTGGEPLLQPEMAKLLELLRQDLGLRVEIETNGSVDIRRFLPAETKLTAFDSCGKTAWTDTKSGKQIPDNVTFTLDYKTSVSGMEDKMCLANFQNVRSVDTVKFVVGSQTDLWKAKEIIETYGLREKGCGIYLSPCFGEIEPATIVDFLVEQKLNDVNIQLQLHKFIWHPDKRGV